MTRSETAALDSYQKAFYVVVGDLEPGYSFAVGVGVEVVPVNYGRVEMALGEEEAFCCHV